MSDKIYRRNRPVWLKVAISLSVLFGVSCLFLLGLFIWRNQLLLWVGNSLITETPNLKPAQAIVVFSGGPWDRGNEAAILWKQRLGDQIICTGENIPHDFKVLGINLPESELTRIQLIRQGVDSTKIQLIRRGTSTFEEIEVIREFCQIQKIQSIILVSSKFHTYRIKKYVQPKLEKIGVDVQIHGAPASNFPESSWWADEDGLLFVNNEYVKLLYYWIKY